MKMYLASFLLLHSLVSFGATMKLPRGGSLPVDDKIWDPQSFEMKGEKVMTLLHKKHKDLQGFVLGGQIREKAPCENKAKDKNWNFCRKKSVEGKITNEQVIAQRKVSDKSFQIYLFSFNLPPGKEKEYSPQIDEFLKKLKAKP